MNLVGDSRKLGIDKKELGISLTKGAKLIEKRDELKDDQAREGIGRQMSVGTDRLGSTTEMGCCLKEETRLMGASEVNRRSNEDEVFEESDCGLRVPGRTPDPLLAPSNSLHLPFPLVALFSFCVWHY
ncbi:hypothetical protein V6N13_058542 [Hibiscus sabdariffa]